MNLKAYHVYTNHFHMKKSVVNKHLIQAVDKRHAADLYYASEHHAKTKATIVRIVEVFTKSVQKELGHASGVGITPKGGLFDLNEYKKFGARKHI